MIGPKKKLRRKKFRLFVCLSVCPGRASEAIEFRMLQIVFLGSELDFEAMVGAGTCMLDSLRVKIAIFDVF